MLEYPWNPHESLNIENWNFSANTKEEATEIIRANIHHFLFERANYHIDNIYHLSIQNAMNHVAETDIVTNALANARIPSTALTTSDTLRFLIAYQYEKELGFEEMVAIAESRVYLAHTGKYQIHFGGVSSRFLPIANRWAQNAAGVTEILKAWQPITAMAPLLTQANADIVRRSGLIKVGNLTGMKIETLGNPMVWRYQDSPPMAITIPVNTEVITRDFARMNQIEPGNRVNQTDGIKLTALNGPIEISWLGNTATTVLVKDAEQTIDNAEFTSKVTLLLKPIDLPKAIGSLSDISSIDIGVTESVDLQNLFEGHRLNITATSSRSSVARPQVNQAQTSMGVVAVSKGRARITVTATNEAGSVSIPFSVTVVEGTTG